MTVDIKMVAEGKVRFEELYKLTDEERNKLRESDGYRLALMDLWEMASAAFGMTSSYPDFYQLFGQAAYEVAIEKRKITGNIT
jgi:hypothetical protein